MLRQEAAVATTSQLATVPPAQRAEGIAQYVNAENAWYKFEAGIPAGTDVAPVQGSGRWVEVTTPDQVIAPFQKTYTHSDSTALAENIEVFYPATITTPHRDAIEIADRISYSVIPPANHRDAMAIADKITYSVILPANHRDAIAMADKIAYLVLGVADYAHKDAIAIAERHHYQYLSALDSDTIVVDNNGDVITSGGFVVSTDGNSSFDTIVVDNNGDVVTSGGFVVNE
ncbi:MAG: hypothetical protein ACRC62_21405 [Microcoleus sp.]